MSNTPGDTSSRTAFDWGASRLWDCVHFHKCSQPVPNTKLPTRVLDLSPPESNDVQQLRLYETDQKYAPYACLSHCWGELPRFTLTRGKISSYKENINLDSLPDTFREAVQFVRLLGIRYLWIDSLCIIQDDEQDWEKESMLMCSIYQGSTLTISAAVSSNCSEGCYRKASVESCGSRVPISIRGDFPDIWVRKPLLHTPLDVISSRRKDTIDEPLKVLTRGWVYQERLLAPRVLHFSAEELVWECAESFCCECSCIRSPSPKFTHANRLRTGVPDELALYWRRLVMAFSGLALTHFSDRLPALSGLAKQFSGLRKGPYLAGLWGDSFLSDLMWRPSPFRTSIPLRPKDSRAPDSRAPTWSWVSVEAEIWFEARYDEIVHPFCTILDVSCVPSSQDLTGRVSSGDLRVSGYLIKVKMTRRANFGKESTWVVDVDGPRRPPLHSDTMPITSSAFRPRIPPWYSYGFKKKEPSSIISGSSSAASVLTVSTLTLNQTRLSLIMTSFEVMNSKWKPQMKSTVSK
jgi:hypothetical protein